uniref:Uncharacterized protein n=1 Tax=Globodera rostochiensis TaxID=31243 RepID=A0A914HPR7_GLORO
MLTFPDPSRAGKSGSGNSAIDDQPSTSAEAVFDGSIEAEAVQLASEAMPSMPISTTIDVQTQTEQEFFIERLCAVRKPDQRWRSALIQLAQQRFFSGGDRSKIDYRVRLHTKVALASSTGLSEPGVEHLHHVLNKHIDFKGDELLLKIGQHQTLQKPFLTATWDDIMEEFWILILVLFFATNSLDTAESVKLEEKQFKIIDEIFGEGWWDNEKDKEWHKLTLEHNIHHQVDRQNTEIGQIKPNSTDQNAPLTEYDHSGQIEPNSTDQNAPLTEHDHSGQIEPNSTDQNPPLTEHDHSGQIEPNSTDQNPPLKEYDNSENAKNDEENSPNENIAEDERKHETVAKKLGLNFTTIYNWKRDLGQIKLQHNHSDSEQMELMKHYYKIKDQNPKIRDADIAKMLKIGKTTLYNWKKQFKRQQFLPNSVNEHSVEENAAANIQEIENSKKISIYF